FAAVVDVKPDVLRGASSARVGSLQNYTREVVDFAMASLSEIVTYTDDFLRIREVGDWDNALNGLQIENSGQVTRIGAAVDGSTRVLTQAARNRVDLLLVHHGLFWAGLQPVKSAF